MTHKCDYCDTSIKPCAQPCSERAAKSHVCCTCDIDPTLCESPERVICTGVICQFKFQTDFYETKLQDLKLEVKSEASKLKDISNTLRILGIGPEALEVLIRNHEINIPGIFINHDETFSWASMPTEDLVTVGLRFLNSYEKVTKQWASWLNEKAIKVHIKKEQLETTQANIKKAEKIRNKEVTGDAKPKLVKFNAFEKVVVAFMERGLTQEQAESHVRKMGMDGEARKIEI